MLYLACVCTDDRTGRGKISLNDRAFRDSGLKQGQASAAGFGQVYGFTFAGRLPKIGQHQGAHLRCLLSRLHGRDQVFYRIYTQRQAVHGHFQVPHHDMELVVEMVGNGPGHAAQAFGLLKLPVLSFELCLFRFISLAIGDVTDNSNTCQWLSACIPA